MTGHTLGEVGDNAKLEGKDEGYWATRYATCWESLKARLGISLRSARRFFIGMVAGNALVYVLGQVEGEVEGKVEGCVLGPFLGLVDGDALCDVLGEVEGKLECKVEGCIIGL